MGKTCFLTTIIECKSYPVQLFSLRFASALSNSHPLHTVLLVVIQPKTLGSSTVKNYLQLNQTLRGDDWDNSVPYYSTRILSVLLNSIPPHAKRLVAPRLRTTFNSVTPFVVITGITRFVSVSFGSARIKSQSSKLSQLPLMHLISSPLDS